MGATPPAASEELHAAIEEQRRAVESQFDALFGPHRAVKTGTPPAKVRLFDSRGQGPEKPRPARPAVIEPAVSVEVVFLERTRTGRTRRRQTESRPPPPSSAAELCAEGPARRRATWRTCGDIAESAPIGRRSRPGCSRHSGAVG